MCLFGGAKNRPKVDIPVPEPPPVPPPPEKTPTAPQIDDARKQSEAQKISRKGRRSLRIDIGMGGANSSGLNVPGG